MFKVTLPQAGVLFLACLSGAISRPAQAGAPPIPSGVVTVDVPCDMNNSGKTALRNCSYYFNGHDPFYETAPDGTPKPGADPGILKILNDRFATQINALYGRYPEAPPAGPLPPGWKPNVTQHTTTSAFGEQVPLALLFDPDVAPGTSPPGTGFALFSPNVCNRVGISGGPVDIAEEIDKSHDSATCGKPLAFTIDPGIVNTHSPVSASAGPPPGCYAKGSKTAASSSKVSCDAVDSSGSCTSSSTACASNKPPNCQLGCPTGTYWVSGGTGDGSGLFYNCITDAQPWIKVSVTNGDATQENGYLQGAFGSALACFYQKKVKEIQSGKLTIEDIPYGGTMGASQCKGQGAALKYLSDQTKSGFDTLMSSLSASGIVGSQFLDIVNCKQTWDNDASTVSNPRVSSLRQQAQYLCAMRADVEEAFYRMTECQILALAQAAWYNVVVDNLPAYWTDTIQKKVVEPCGHYCKYIMANNIFHAPADKQTSSSMGPSGVTAGFDAVGCWLCKAIDKIPLLSCDWGGPGKACDMSNYCPVKSPYEDTPPDGGFQVNYEAAEDNKINNGVPTITDLDAQKDINACEVGCYLHGVEGGKIQTVAAGLPPVKDSTPAHNEFSVPTPAPTDPATHLPVPVSIPKYTAAIWEYLNRQWPKTYDPARGCALSGPNLK